MLFQAFPVMLGDIDLKGNLNAQIIHQFTDAIRGKFIVQVCSNIISNFKRDFKYIKSQVIDKVKARRQLLLFEDLLIQWQNMPLISPEQTYLTNLLFPIKYKVKRKKFSFHRHFK